MIETNLALPKESTAIGRAVLEIARANSERAVRAAIEEAKAFVAHRENVLASITDPAMRESVIRFIKAS